MIKTSTLTGALLDYHVARAEGIPADQLEIREVPRTDLKICVRGGLVRIAPSTDWGRCGPLLEKYQMSFGYEADNYWRAATADGAEGHDIFKPMIAICRAVVRQAFGEEVEDLP